MDTTKEKIVPPQAQGAKKDIEYTVTAFDENDARKLFVIGRNRLMSINNWHLYAKPISATFKLTDQEGKEVNRTAEKDDLFKIDLPAPGSAEGKGFDWVRIEAIEDESNAEGQYEFVAIRVRPVPNPEKEGQNVAHFFTDTSTSSFVIERHGNQVTAAVYGRNEIPNTETSNVVDKIRNAVVGITAILGFSNIQWSNLVKGFIETAEG